MPDEPFRNDYERENHPDCDCLYGYRLSSMSEDAFYDKYHSAWELLHPLRYTPSATASTATVASDSETIWAATPYFGHHCVGVHIGQVTPEYVPVEHALFYYRELRELDTSPWKRILMAAKQHDMQTREVKQQVRILELKQEERLVAQRNMDVFK